MRSTPFPRRAFLGLLAGTTILHFARVAHADPPSATPSRIRAVTEDERGYTFYLELESAPFPAPGSWYKDPTVIVFVPKHFRLPSDDRVSALVHFHGHSSTAEEAMVRHELREQLFDSKQNALLVVPQGPVHASDSSEGKIEAPGGFARMMGDVLRMLKSNEGRATLGPAAIHARARLGTVCISAHSGGYHAVASCLKFGGAEVNEVYLFDSLYADLDAFRDWVIAGKGRPAHTRHKLVSFYTEGTTAFMSGALLRELERAGVECAFERVEGTLSREEITRAEAVFIKTGLSHGGVTHELNGLRDCLFASGLTRRLPSSWFARKSDPRKLERRR